MWKIYTFKFTFKEPTIEFISCGAFYALYKIIYDKNYRMSINNIQPRKLDYLKLNKAIEKIEFYSKFIQDGF